MKKLSTDLLAKMGIELPGISLKSKEIFEYCECGCKCYVANGRSIYWDFKKYWLWSGHGQNGYLIGEYSSKEEAEADSKKFKG